LLINAIGSALIGVLMVLVDVRGAHRLVRPFVGTGVLGGFTTFSTFAADVERLLAGGAAPAALAYFVITPALVLMSVWLASEATRRWSGGFGHESSDRKSSAADRSDRGR
jgi:CrcB protein